MFEIIKSTAEIKSVTHFLTARNILAVDIHCQSCDKYGSNAISESKVQNLVRQFKDGLESVYDKPCFRPTIS